MVEEETEIIKEEENDDDDIGTSEYSPKSEFSKPKLVEIAVQKCFEARSQEMKEGYNNYKTDHDGRITAKIWIPDSRKIFDSHIIALKNLLSPEIEKDKTFKDKEKKINEKKKAVFDKHCYSIMIQKRVDGKMIWFNSLDKIMPSKDVLVVCLDRRTNRYIEGKGYWNEHLKSYWDELVPINDELFSALNILIDSINYFKQRSSY